jgi:integrase
MSVGDELADSKCPGLRARRGARGAVALFYRFKVDGAQREVKIGDFGPLTLAKAREKVDSLRYQRKHDGVDIQTVERAKRGVVEQERRQRAEPAPNGFETFAGVAEHYLVNHVEATWKEKGAADLRRLFERDILPTLGKRRVGELTKTEISSLVRSHLERGVPSVARGVRREVRAALEYAANEELIPEERAAVARDVLKAARKKLKQGERDRFLEEHEVAKLVPWMRKNYTRTVSDALMLTLYTGCRSGEVTSWQWSWFDPKAGTVVMPETKNSKAFTVTLPRQAVTLLEARREQRLPGKNGKRYGDTKFVFPNQNARGRTAVLQKALGVEVYAHSGASDAEVYKEYTVCPVKDWTPHDLRRTARTMLQQIDCPIEVGEKILNHTLTGVLRIYARDPMLRQRRDWLQKLADHIDQIVAKG